MHAVIVGPDPSWLAWLEERARRGNDHRDEVWDGVLHVVPPVSTAHQSFEGDLAYEVLRPIAKRLGLVALCELDVFGPSKRGRKKNYRIPDVLVADREHVSERGVEQRAELVIEVLSPHDESREKFGFYAECGIPEYWLVDPITRAIEVHVLRDGAYQLQPTRDDGTIEAPRLALTLRVIDGPKLRIDWDGGSAEI